MKMVYLENNLVFSDEIMNRPEGIQKQVYEVLRVIAGKPLFWEDHFSRMVQSAAIAGMEYNISTASFCRQLLRLIELNKITEGNIRIDLFQLTDTQLLRLAFIPHSYPSPSDYEQGVPVGLLHGERENPHAKIVQQNLRDQANQLMAEKKLYEVLLVDHRGLITEGSRSNVFFVRGNCFFTPRAEQILLGITRTKVLECIRHLGFKTEECDIPVDHLSLFDAVFLTGTSPKVLPVHCVGELIFQVENSAVRLVQAAFDQLVADYLRDFPLM